MLETPKERVELLKAGIASKKIEELYVMHNNLRIIRSSMFFELVEINSREDNNITAEATAEAGI